MTLDEKTVPIFEDELINNKYHGNTKSKQNTANFRWQF